MPRSVLSDMSDDPFDKVVTWGDVYKQTVGLSEEAAEQQGSDWGEEGYEPFRCSSALSQRHLASISLF